MSLHIQMWDIFQETKNANEYQLVMASLTITHSMIQVDLQHIYCKNHFYKQNN